MDSNEDLHRRRRAESVSNFNLPTQAPFNSMEVNFSSHTQPSFSSAVLPQSSGPSTSGAIFPDARNIQHSKKPKIHSDYSTASTQSRIGSAFLKPDNVVHGNSSNRPTIDGNFSFTTPTSSRPASPPLLRPASPPLLRPPPPPPPLRRLPPPPSAPLSCPAQNNLSVKPQSEANQTTSLISDITLLNSISGLGLDPMGETDRYMYAVVEGRASSCREIGFALIDLLGNKIILSQFADDLLYSRLYTKFSVYFPSRVIVPKTSETNESFLEFLEILQIPVTFLERRIFNDVYGKQKLEEFYVDDFVKIEQNIHQKYYALSAVSGLFHHCQTFIVFIPKTIFVEYHPSDNCMAIDPITVQSLELVVNTTNYQHTLLHLLDKTKTIDGKRLLKSSILEPSCDPLTIINRQDCVEELTSDTTVFQMIAESFNQLDVYNVRDVITKVVRDTVRNRTAHTRLQCAVNLKAILKQVPTLRDALLICKNSLFKSFAAHLHNRDFENIDDILKSILREDVNYDTLRSCKNKCHLLKRGLSARLDQCLDIHNQILIELETHGKEVKDSHGFQLLFQGHQYLLVGSNEILPGFLFQGFQRNGKFLLTNQTLVNINYRLNNSLNDCMQEVGALLALAFAKIRENVQCLYQLSEIIPTIDFMLSLAKSSLQGRWVRPKLSDCLTIENGVHPIWAGRPQVQANGIHMERLQNVAIISGSNNSGKSVFIKQVALLQVMAQIGCFVPASGMIFPVRDRILARIGSNDDIRSNSSTFLVEVRQTLFILANATDKSLVVIDELGRGTGAELGAIFCFAAVEELLLKRSLVLLATHYTELHFLELNPSCVNYYMETIERFDENEHSFRHTYKLLPGIQKIENYGVKMAKMIGYVGFFLAFLEETEKESDAHELKFKMTQELKLRNLNFKTGLFLKRLEENYRHLFNFDHIIRQVMADRLELETQILAQPDID